MIELLIVMFILAILIALAVGVGQWVFSDAARKATLSTQEVLFSAIETFHDIEGEWPEGEGDENSAHRLWEQLVDEHDRTREIVEALDRESFDRDNEVFLDGYGNPIRYDDSGGIAGRPVLISAGPDGDFSTSEDNIRSDNRSDL
jgi:type II secretory pathway pseudopilin PulG